ncbi:MAG: redoxin domain-containing protein [Chloroflexota bacterium]|nr:redoxin domain-containing protein [Chloroflexota bacterium]
MDYRYAHFKGKLLVEGLWFDGPPPGQTMPDFDLPATDGSHVRRDDFLGQQPLLLIFGSITCPMTASADSALKRLHAEFGDHVEFITLYVREAHPGERYPQPETIEQKLAHARAYQNRHQIPWTVVADNIEGELHRALGARNPNPAYLMDTDGTITFRSLWSNDYGALRAGLEAIISGRPSPIGERWSLVVPALKGLGVMDEVLDLAGQQARRDFRREVPPVYALVRLAALFRPLPPLGRGIAAVASGTCGLITALAGMRWLLWHGSSPISGETAFQ